MESFFQQPVNVFWCAVAVMVVVPSLAASVSIYLLKSRKAELEASLKMRMVEAGMSADDIERVIQSEGPGGANS